MSFSLKLPGKRTSQPHYPAPVDRNNLLGRNVKLLLMPVGGNLVDVVNPSVFWTKTNANIIGTPRGMAASMDGVDDYWTSASAYADITGNTGTFFFWAPRLTNGADGRFLMLTAGSVYFGHSASNTYAFGIAGGAASPYGTDVSEVYSSGGTAGTLRHFLNGAQSAATWASGPASWGAGAKAITFGRYTTNTWDSSADVVLAGYTSDIWGPAEARAFHENPWQILKPVQRRIWVPSAAGGAFKAAWARNANSVITAGNMR